MLQVLPGWRLDRVGLFYFGMTSRGTPAGRLYGLVQPPRLLSRGQSQERPRPNATPNNDVRTDTCTTPGHRRCGACANEEIRECRKSPWNKAYLGVWPNSGHNIGPIQVGPARGREDWICWFSGVRRAEKPPTNSYRNPTTHDSTKPPFGRLFLWRELCASSRLCGDRPTRSQSCHQRQKERGRSIRAWTLANPSRRLLRPSFRCNGLT